jgi:hypothetical protein
MQTLRQVGRLSEGEIQQLLDAGILATRPREAAKPAVATTRSDVRERGTRFDPDYKDRMRHVIDPLAAAAGSDD